MALNKPQEHGTNGLHLFSTHGDDTAYILFYVDDIILTTSSHNLRDTIIAALRSEFSMTDLGPLNYFLGVWRVGYTSLWWVILASIQVCR